MADEKGSLSNEQEKQLAIMVDDVIKLKGFWELVDGYVARVIISLVDDFAIEKLKAEVKTQLAKIADAGIAKDVPRVEAETSVLLNLAIDIPGLDEPGEALIFQSAVNLIGGLIRKWIAKENS